MTSGRFMFVGEERSPTAIRMGVTWEDGALAAKQLFRGLEAAGIDPSEQKFCNIFESGGTEAITGALQEGRTIVGMGSKVQRELDQLEVQHLKLIHPAARGAIRKIERYNQHCVDILSNV